MCRFLTHIWNPFSSTFYISVMRKVCQKSAPLDVPGLTTVTKYEGSEKVGLISGLEYVKTWDFWGLWERKLRTWIGITAYAKIVRVTAWSHVSGLGLRQKEHSHWFFRALISKLAILCPKNHSRAYFVNKEIITPYYSMKFNSIHLWRGPLFSLTNILTFFRHQP